MSALLKAAPFVPLIAGRFPGKLEHITWKIILGAIIILAATVLLAFS